MTDLRDDVLTALQDEAAAADVALTSRQLDAITDAACMVFLGRVAQAVAELRAILEPGGFETFPINAIDHCSPDTLLRYCDRMYPETSRQLLAAHAEAWRRDRDDLMIRTGG